MKRYVSEPQSAAFDAFFVAQAPVAVSRLTMVEMRCALARRRRAGQIDAGLERRALEEIRTDIQDGAIALFPLPTAPWRRLFTCSIGSGIRRCAHSTPSIFHWPAP